MNAFIFCWNTLAPKANRRDPIHALYPNSLTVSKRLVTKSIITIVLGSLLVNPSAMASSFEALCGDTPCRIRLDANGLEGPTGFVPANRIAQWFCAGEQKGNGLMTLITSNAGSILKGSVGTVAPGYISAPVGLFGKLVQRIFPRIRTGQSLDLTFNVVGYDMAGKKIVHMFRFLNPKPAKEMQFLLPLVSGLAMGQTRSLDELRRAAPTSGESSVLPDKLESADRDVQQPRSRSLTRRQNR